MNESGPDASATYALPEHVRMNLKKHQRHAPGMTCLECGYTGLVGVKSSWQQRASHLFCSAVSEWWLHSWLVRWSAVWRCLEAMKFIPARTAKQTFNAANQASLPYTNPRIKGEPCASFALSALHSIPSSSLGVSSSRPSLARVSWFPWGTSDPCHSSGAFRSHERSQGGQHGVCGL